MITTRQRRDVPTWIDDGSQIIYADSVFHEVREDTVLCHLLRREVLPDGSQEYHRNAVVVFTLKGFTESLGKAMNVWGMGHDGSGATH